MDEKKGLIELASELWLAQYPEDAELEFETAQEDKLDCAAKAAGDTIVLAAHWGNDIPNARDEAWLADILRATRPDDQATVEDTIRAWWEA